MPEARFDGWLRELGLRSNEKVGADSLAELLGKLEQRYPRLRFKIRDELGHVLRYVRPVVDCDDLSVSTREATSVTGTRKVDILLSNAGG